MKAPPAAAIRRYSSTLLTFIRHMIGNLHRSEELGQLQRGTGFGIQEIMRVLPHRYPMLLVDRVVQVEGFKRAVGIKNVTINEPFFGGHYPDMPIMPAVLTLEALAQLHQVETIPVARFIRQEARGLPWGSTMVIVAAQIVEDLSAVLLDLKRAGRRIALVKVGGEPPEREGNLNTYHVTDEVAWDLVREIGLNEVGEGRRL